MSRYKEIKRNVREQLGDENYVVDKKEQRDYNKRHVNIKEEMSWQFKLQQKQQLVN